MDSAQNSSPASSPRAFALLCLAIIAALLVVGAVSHGVLRHIVQTSPLWVTVVLGARGSTWSKWTALPCFGFWLLLMTAIWLFLLGWARIVSGTFAPTEIAMTIVVGTASIAGLVLALFTKTKVRALAAAAVFLLVGVLQVVAVRASLLPNCRSLSRGGILRLPAGQAHAALAKRAYCCENFVVV